MNLTFSPLCFQMEQQLRQMQEDIQVFLGRLQGSQSPSNLPSANTPRSTPTSSQSCSRPVLPTRTPTASQSVAESPSIFTPRSTLSALPTISQPVTNLQPQPTRAPTSSPSVAEPRVSDEADFLCIHSFRISS